MTSFLLRNLLPSHLYYQLTVYYYKLQLRKNVTVTNIHSQRSFTQLQTQIMVCFFFPNKMKKIPKISSLISLCA